MNTIENLAKGDLLLIKARKVKGEKVELEFAQHVQTSEGRQTSILGLLNASDERFNQTGGPTHCWMSGVPADIQKAFNIDLSSLQNEGDILELGILNPTVVGINEKLNIRIVETVKPTKYQSENIETTAKRAGKDGDYIVTKNGEFIYRNAEIVPGEPKHLIFQDTVRNVVTLSNEIEDQM